MEIDIIPIEVCDLVALCESAGKFTGDPVKFQRIANKLKKSIGVEK